MLGLVYSWLVSPVKYIDAPPYALRADYKDEYRALIAVAYLYSHDLLRAQDRLAQLQDNQPARTLTMQAQRALAEGQPEEVVQGLSDLAVAMSQVITPSINSTQTTPGAAWLPALEVSSDINTLPENTSPSGTVTIIPPQDPQELSTAQVTPQILPGSTQAGLYVLKDVQLVCDSTQSMPLIEVEIMDSSGQPQAGKEVLVTWMDGQDHFFTGLKPELGVGYGDFLMTPAVVYSVKLAEGGQAASNVLASQCSGSDGSQYWGSWLLTFMQSR